jgi:hypothetical protein
VDGTSISFGEGDEGDAPNRIDPGTKDAGAAVDEMPNLV